MIKSCAVAQSFWALTIVFLPFPVLRFLACSSLLLLCRCSAAAAAAAMLPCSQNHQNCNYSSATQESARLVVIFGLVGPRRVVWWGFRRCPSNIDPQLRVPVVVFLWSFSCFFWLRPDPVHVLFISGFFKILKNLG